MRAERSGERPVHVSMAARRLTGGPHDNGRSVTLKHDALTLIAEGTERAGSVSTPRRKRPL